MPADFESYVAARGHALLRLAYLLTGNEADAQDVVQEALSRAVPRWARITQADDPDAYVRRMVVNAHVSWWRKFKRRESPVEDVRPEGTQPGADVETVDRLPGPTPMPDVELVSVLATGDAGLIAVAR